MSVKEQLKLFIEELKLADKFFPSRNPSIAWFWLFLPCMIAYMGLLMQILNGKPHLGSMEVIDEASFGKFAALKYPIEVITTGSKWAE